MGCQPNAAGQAGSEKRHRLHSLMLLQTHQSTHLFAHLHSTVQEEKPEVAQSAAPSDAGGCISEEEVFPVVAAPILAELMLPFLKLSWKKSWIVALSYRFAYRNVCNWSRERKKALSGMAKGALVCAKES